MMVRSLALCAIAAFAFATPSAMADPPKATLVLTNGTAHEAVVEFDAPSTRAWTRMTLAPGAERIVYEIVGPFKLVGTVKSTPPAALVPRDMILSKASLPRLRIELVDGRYAFVKL
jgi:hypothetical protein